MQPSDAPQAEQFARGLHRSRRTRTAPEILWPKECFGRERNLEGARVMITSLYRVDPRLVHATLMNAWVPSISAQQLVIVDTEVASDPRARNILAMSAMDVPIEFVREEDAKAIR